jgi:hypothetical protein
MGVCGSRLKPWRGAPGAVDRTARFLSVILIAAIENCSDSGWREHGKIMWLNVDSMWGDINITLQLTCRSNSTYIVSINRFYDGQVTAYLIRYYMASFDIT